MILHTISNTTAQTYFFWRWVLFRVFFSFVSATETLLFCLRETLPFHSTERSDQNEEINIFKTVFNKCDRNAFFLSELISCLVADLDGHFGLVGAVKCWH